jgi:uncharacterized protein (TIGR00159 family)
MGFIHIGITDIIDIFAVAILMYYLYRMAKKTNALNILVGIIIIFLVWELTRALNMELLSSILGSVLGVGVIALIVVFQPEIRQFLQTLGLSRNKRSNRLFAKIFNLAQQDQKIDITPIVKAATDMAASKTGALIVIQQSNDLTLIADSGIALDAQVSAPILENIFFKNAPLHDGAVVIKENRIVAAKCVLPSTRSNVPKSYGMRHRAALGMSEVSDAIIIAVSEETGGISIAQDSEIKRAIPPDALRANLLRALRKTEQRTTDKSPSKSEAPAKS